MGPPPQIRSRAPSRSQSRAASPALSIKSRKSMMSNRNINRNNFIEHELTDDEDSASDGYVDDFRSLRGRRESSTRSTTTPRRSRKNSTQSSIDLEEDSESFSRGTRSATGTRSSNRDRRSGSVARSVQSGWSAAAKPSVSTATSRSKEFERNDRKHVSDSPMTPDSESEPGTKALVQAKIREKLAQQSSMDESSSDFWKPKTSVKENQSKIESEPKSEVVVEIERKIEPVVEKQPELSRRLDPVEPIDDEILQLINEKPGELDDGPIGPPPAAPEYEWECEFCTFVNEANTKICTICCKTPTSAPSNKKNAATTKKTDNIVNQVQDELKSKLNIANKARTASSSEETNTTKESSGSSSTAGKIKGKTRKISFWPGTKSK